MFVLVRCLVTYFVGWMLATTSLAHAQTDRASDARVLFEQGLAKADAARWLEAADLFQRALEQRDSPVIRFNLASAYAELGRLVEASELLQAVAADQRTQPELMQRVKRDRDAIERRLAHLTIHVDSSEPSWRVLLDEKELAKAMVGVSLPLDPKLHYVSLRAGDRVLDDAQVELAEGDARELKLTGNVPAPVVERPRPAPLAITLVGFGAQQAPREDEAMPKRKKRLIWGVSAAAAAVAAGVVAGVLIARAGDEERSPANAFSPGRVGVRVPE